MKRVTFKILFFIKKTRVSKNGEVPVLLRVTVNGQRTDTSINLKINPDNWNAVAGKSIGKDRKDEEFNNRLDTIRLRIMQIHREMELDGVVISSKLIIDKYLGRLDKPVVMFLDYFREHNERSRKLIGKGLAPATVERYEISLKHISRFIKHSLGKDDIPMDSVNHKFIVDLEFYLKTERNCMHNTTTKYLKNFKKVIRVALANEIITRDPFANIKFHLEEVERDFLEDHELHTILNKELKIERVAQVRDIFMFCCFRFLALMNISLDIN